MRKIDLLLFLLLVLVMFPILLFADAAGAVARAGNAAGIFDQLSQYPIFMSVVSWLFTELGTRFWPTKSATSTFYLLRQAMHALGLVCYALERVFQYLQEHPFAQNCQRATQVNVEPPK